MMTVGYARGRAAAQSMHPWTWISLALATTILIASALFATAQEASWQVASISGAVRVQTDGGAWRPLANGDNIGPGDAVETGDNGEVRLVRSVGDTMTLSPNSRMALPPANAGPQAPSVIQRLGTLLFQIDHRHGIDRFRVQTPYLAAVIKGTVFTVTITPEGGSLSVQEGLVQVNRQGAQAPVLVPAGATVVAPAGNAGQLDLTNPGGKGKSNDNGSSTKPGKDKQGSRDDNGNGKQASNGKGWKAGFDPGVGDIKKSSHGFLNDGRGKGASFASNDKGPNGKAIGQNPPEGVNPIVKDNPSFTNTVAHHGNPIAVEASSRQGPPDGVGGGGCGSPPCGKAKGKTK